VEKIFLEFIAGGDDGVKAARRAVRINEINAQHFLIIGNNPNIIDIAQ
jgi:hypothetical protein